MDVKENYYGEPPVDLGEFKIPVTESMFYLYLPIKMYNSMELGIPPRLERFWPLIEKVRDLYFDRNGALGWGHRYVYLTVKHMLVNPGFWGNRGGAHCDGFGTS